MIGAKHLLEFPGVHLLLSHGPEGETNDGPTQSPNPTVYELYVFISLLSTRKMIETDRYWINPGIGKKLMYAEARPFRMAHFN